MLELCIMFHQMYVFCEVYTKAEKHKGIGWECEEGAATASLGIDWWRNSVIKVPLGDFNIK